MGLIQAIKNLFGSEEVSVASSKKKIITIDTYSPISNLFTKKEIREVGELYVKGPARAGKGDEMFDFVKQMCQKHNNLHFLDLSGVVGLSEVKENALSDCSSLNEIILPSGIIKIETNAFCNCKNLEKISLQEGLERIAEMAFANCPKLTNMKLPKSLYRIGRNVFAGDESLTELVIPSRVESIGTGALDCKNLKTLIVEPHNPSYISKDNIIYSRNGSALIFYALGKPNTEFDIPEHVAKIGEYAFANTNLKHITISHKVNIIGKHAFENCNEMTSINIPANVERIDESAFINCKNLKKVDIEKGVNSLGNQVFKNCTALDDIKLPASIMKIGDEAFANCKSLSILTIPTTVEFMGKDILKGSPADK